MPDPQQLSFPSRAQRKKLVEELKKMGQDPQAASNRDFKKYAEAIEAIDNKMEELSREGENGLPKTLTREDADELAHSLADAAQYGESFIAYSSLMGRSTTTGVPGLVNQLQGMMARDYEALKDYDPAEPKTLPEIQESVRTTTIDLRGRKLGALTNQQNQRIPMAVVDNKGVKRNGVFTKMTQFKSKALFDKVIEDAKAKCTREEERAELDKIFGQYRAGITGKKKRNGGLVNAKTDDAYVVGSMVLRLYGQLGDGKVTTDAVKELLRKNTTVNQRLIPSKAMKALADGLNGLKNNIGLEINSTRLGLDENERVDSRNSAMSSVAGLLGCSKILAKSENMKFIGEDGKETEGTFMEFAKGVDLYQKQHLFKHLAINPFGSTAAKNSLFKQIADLQVLDFLCGNEDRHPGNVLYDVDKDGHIKGIVGIDNDSTFPNEVSKSHDVTDLRVISKSMADKVLALTPAMLRFSLRGRGLSEKALETAVDNLIELQSAVKNKDLITVEDKNFWKVDINKLSPKVKNNDNMFCAINRYINHKVSIYRDPDRPFEPLPDQPEPDLPEVYTTNRKYTVGGLTDSLRQVSRKVVDRETKFNVDNLTTKMRGSSPQFKNMVNAAKDADRLLKRLAEDPNVDISKLATEDPDTLKKVDDAFTKIDDLADTYLAFKLGERGRNNAGGIKAKNSYEQKHIDYANDLKKIAAGYRKSLGLPENESDALNLSSNIKRRELEIKKAEQPQQNGPVA